MTHLARLTPGLALALALGLVGLLQACQLASPGGQGNTDVTPNAVAGDAIEVTSLDAPAANPADLAPTGLATAPPQVAAPASGVATDPVPAPIPDSGATSAAGPDSPAADAEAPGEAEPVPEAVAAPKSEKQLACERKDGNWVTAFGKLKACVFPTRDSGKRCERESQCEGVCLARSGTCAPVKPLYGCNEILQDNGARVTLCLE